MGLIEILHKKTVYLDTNIFIYAIEHVDIYEQLLDSLFKQIDSGNIYAITSTLTLAEILVKPFADNNVELIEIYQNLLIGANIINLVEINQDILINSAKYRATFKIKLPDAIHIITAISSNSDFLLTNDERIKTQKSIKILQLSDYCN